MTNINYWNLDLQCTSENKTDHSKNSSAGSEATNKPADIFEKYRLVIHPYHRIKKVFYQ